MTSLLACLALFAVPAAHAQDALDRANPAIVGPDLTMPRSPPKPAPTPVIAAEAADVAAPRMADGVLVGGIRVEGASALKPADFAPAIMPWLGRTLGGDDLRQVATAIADVARARGFAFARASVPRQALANGILTVRIDEGRVDGVMVEGDDTARIAALLAPLANGRPVERGALEATLLLVDDIPGVAVGAVRLRRDPARNILIVPLTFEAVTARADIDNRGTGLIGPTRARLSFDFSGLLTRRDVLSVEAAITPADPREFRLFGASYAVRPGQSGTEIELSGYHALTKAGGIYRDLGITGENYEVAVNVTHPIVRRKAASLWANGGFAVRRTEQGTDGLRIRNDRLSVATFGLEGFGVVAGGVARGSVTTAIGLDLFGATRRGDTMSSRPETSGRFASWSGSVVWTRPLNKQFTLRVAGEGQVASRPLLVGEQFSIGGARYLRAYDYGERLGDEGAAGSLELSFRLAKTPKPVTRADLYAFVDGGVVADKGVRGSDSLASAGGGVRVGIARNFAATAEVAVPLTGPRFETGTRRPRLSFTLSALF